MKEKTRQKAVFWTEKFIEFYIKHLPLALTIEVILLGLAVYGIVSLIAKF